MSLLMDALNKAEKTKQRDMQAIAESISETELPETEAIKAISIREKNEFFSKKYVDLLKESRQRTEIPEDDNAADAPVVLESKSESENDIETAFSELDLDATLDEEITLSLDAEESTDINTSELDWSIALAHAEENEDINENNSALTPKKEEEVELDWSTVSIEIPQEIPNSLSESATVASPITLAKETHNRKPEEFTAPNDSANIKETQAANFSIVSGETLVITEDAPNLDWGETFVPLKDDKPVINSPIIIAEKQAPIELDFGNLFSEKELTPNKNKSENSEDQLQWDEALLPFINNTSITDSFKTKEQPPAQKIPAHFHKNSDAKIRWTPIYRLIGLAMLTAMGMAVFFYVVNENDVKLRESGLLKTTPPLSQIQPFVAPEVTPTENIVLTPSVQEQASPKSPEPTVVKAEQPPEKKENLPKTPAVASVPESAVAKNNPAPLSVSQNSASPATVKNAPEKLAATPTTSRKTDSKPSTPITPPPRELLSDKKNAPLPPIQRNLNAEKAAALTDTLNAAYRAFQANQLAQAESYYQAVLNHDKKNKDALLGLAAIAMQKGQTVQAQYYYQTVLSHYPQDRTARLALLGQMQSGETHHNERELKALLNDDKMDKGHIYFSLGALYARENRWSAAQQSFFEAWRHQKQAHYAYNLAISLEHLNQAATAVIYYQQALALYDKNAQQARFFNPDIVQQRIKTLSGTVRTQDQAFHSLILE
ncbi:tetratricopeptide repeat protein [Thioflexithrix psekupsensis]|uniref:Uncharacterized protein n=1 Tax=Thioflexithrix psekupsensis TaxID=1570016 RepID=A0A251X9B3_9GAMM|nr:tetratricopeptide repeat protein [Thioflexithrix psekupsensis]OUD14561.1 hypothetical protein TPSD3_09745 [Thioflexithrix psekupsensis]